MILVSSLLSLEEELRRGKGIINQILKTHSIAFSTFAPLRLVPFSHHIRPGLFVHTSRLFRTPPSVNLLFHCSSFSQK